MHALGELHGIETAVLRYFNVFGPGQDPSQEYSAVIPRFIAAVLLGARPTIYGNGQISRDFIYVDDVVSANLLAADSSSPTGITVNVASGTSLSILDLLAAINHASGTSLEPRFAPARAGDIARSEADIKLAMTALGFRPGIPFADGLAETVAWYRHHRGSAQLP